MPGAGHLPSFFVPAPGHLDGLCVPTLGNLPIFLKKNANARGLARGGGAWAPLELTDALHLTELRFASQLLLEPPIIPITKQNNTDKKLDFNTGRMFVICDKSENTKLSILIKYILNSSA